MTVPATNALGKAIRAARLARGLSQPDLARSLGVAEGRGPYGLDRQSVYRWETGGRVPTYWLPYIRDVLDLEWPPSQTSSPEEDHNDGASHAVDSVASVLAIGRLDVERRAFFQASSAYALSVLALPDLESVTRRTAGALRATGSLRVGRGEVAALRQMTRHLGDAAAELGGGHARHLVVRYLTEDVAPWLNGSCTEAVHRELFAATSQLVHLAGWMAGDEGNQGLAQKYYAHSYRLAAEAGDAELAATALRGMAVQAIDLGHHAAAIRLSERCVHYARSIHNPRAVSYYQTTLANAASRDYDRTTATASLARAEAAIEHDTNETGESWAAHYSPGRWAHDAGMILARLGDLDAAEEHLTRALDVYGLDRRRSRAIVLADLGQVHLQRHDIDAALTTWGTFLSSAEGVRSVKVNDALVEMRARLDKLKERGITEAAELDERAATVSSCLHG